MPSRTFFGYIQYFKLYNFVKKTEDSTSFDKPIKALYTNRDGHSEICVDFRVTFRKQHPEDNIHRITASYIQRLTFRGL